VNETKDGANARMSQKAVLSTIVREMEAIAKKGTKYLKSPTQCANCAPNSKQVLLRDLIFTVIDKDIVGTNNNLPAVKSAISSVIVPALKRIEAFENIIGATATSGTGAVGFTGSTGGSTGSTGPAGVEPEIVASAGPFTDQTLAEIGPLSKAIGATGATVSKNTTGLITGSTGSTGSRTTGHIVDRMTYPSLSSLLSISLASRSIWVIC
jgi:hypothetical protein